MKLYILRHGTTAWNVQHLIQGASDTPLDGPGEAMARETGRNLAALGIRFSHVFSSPLSRAVKTAQLAAPGCGIRTDERLLELHFGSFEGRSVPDLRADENCPFRYFSTAPDLYNDAILPYEAAGVPEGCAHPFESLTTLCARTKSFLQEVIEPMAAEVPADTCVLISGHGAMNKALMMHIQGTENLAGFWGKGLQTNCGIYLAETAAAENGGICWQTDEVCHTYYDPELIRGVTGLLS